MDPVCPTDTLNRSEGQEQNGSSVVRPPSSHHQQSELVCYGEEEDSEWLNFDPNDPFSAPEENGGHEKDSIPEMCPQDEGHAANSSNEGSSPATH